MAPSEIGLVLIAALVHFAIAKAFEKNEKLNLWLVSRCLDHGNAWYEYYLETKADRSKTPMKIEEVRRKAEQYLSDADGVIALHSRLTARRNLFLGSWITYGVLCVSVGVSASIMRATVANARSDRIRRENLRA